MREITNLASPQAKHAYAATLRLIDENHLADEWHFVQNGKKTTVKTTFVRTKPGFRSY
jgi:hypothetical protein